MTDRPIKRAYEATGALDQRCPNCHAGPGLPCIRTDDHGTQHRRKIPCVARAQRPLDVQPIADYDVEATETDFTEPRHPPHQLEI